MFVESLLLYNNLANEEEAAIAAPAWFQRFEWDKTGTQERKGAPRNCNIELFKLMGALHRSVDGFKDLMKVCGRSACSLSLMHL